MSEATTALQPPPASIDPQQALGELRGWVIEHCIDHDPVRRAAYQMALSAVAHRLLKYGPDESLNGMSSRDLMALLLYTNGTLAEYLMRLAYFRSIIEGEHAIYEHMNTTLFISECRAWYWTIAEAMLGKAPNPDEVTTWLEQMIGEEKAVARLIIARVYPDTAHIDWLHDLPETTSPPHAMLAAQLCEILIREPKYEGIVKNYLRTHPHVRYGVENDQQWGL